MNCFNFVFICFVFIDKSTEEDNQTPDYSSDPRINRFAKSYSVKDL